MKNILFFLLLINNILYAQGDAYNPERSERQLYEFASYVNVEDRDLSINQIINEVDLEYKPITSENFSVGFTSQHYWVKFKLQNTTAERASYYLKTARPITDQVDLYQINGAAIKKAQSGDQLPFEDRQVDHRQSVFKLELPASSTTTIYIHYKSDGETLNLPLDLYTPFEFLVVNYKQQLFLGLFYGLLFPAGIIYLFFYTGMREKIFLYYGLYVFSIGLMQAALDGFIYQYILTEAGYLNSRMVLITALLSNFFLLKYCQTFLRISRRLPKFRNAYNAIYIVIAVLFVMTLMGSEVLAIVYPLSNLNGLLSLILILTSLFTLRFRGRSVDIYFSIGIFFLVVGLLGFVLNNLSLLPNNFYTLNSAKFGTGFEIVFLSLSMTNLIKVLRREKEKSQQIALEKSEEISELKTFFMSNISHELRTPINAIMGIANTELESKKLDSDQEASLKVIRDASYSLLSNVNDVLDFEHIEKNELVLHHVEFNPKETLLQISDNWKIKAQKKGLSYSIHIDESIPYKISGDKDRFVQIINNVLANALKFTSQGGIAFNLLCQQHKSNTSRFIITINDTGVGMNEMAKNEVFNSFNQMRQNHKRQFGGVGLGLTIVKHLVKLFDGTIQIDSVLDKGTNVTVTLPLEVVALEGPKKPSTLEAQDQLSQHVLIVEDNKLNQLVIKKILSTAPALTFEVAENGKEALEILQKETFDVILMDLQMPVMDGYEATKNIRNGSIGHHLTTIPIIAVTADATEKSRTYALEIGMNDYITKPVNKEVLFNSMRSCDVLIERF